MWLANTLGNAAIGLGAWIQDRYFEPEQLDANWIVFSYNGILETHHQLPITTPGSGLWHRTPGTENYERMDIAIPSHEPPTPLAFPIIQAVVRLPAHSRRHRRSRNKPRDMDITNELTRFGGEPILDWLHVGVCVKHAYGIHVLPGQYELSLIDSEFNMHNLTEEQAAVFSAISQDSVPSPVAAPSPLLPGPEMSDEEPDPEMEQGHDLQEEEDEEPEPLPWGYDPWDSDDERSVSHEVAEEEEEPDPEMESDWDEGA